MKIFKLNLEDKDYFFRLGESAKENHQLIDYADQNDWWFHLDNFPSGHCIVDSVELNHQLINYAANIVKENSKYRNLKNIKIVYLQVKNIKKTKNPGEVKLLKKGNLIKI